MLTLIKLGGSLITDKRVETSFREGIMGRLAYEIRAALEADPDLRIIIGHGSGSFGHFSASRYRTIEGVHTPEEWRGFAQVATVAAQLNYLVANSLQSAGIPIWRIQPSASAMSQDGLLKEMALEPFRQASAHGLVPLVYGDVAIDSVRGGTIISTEAIFFYLTHHLPVDRILLLGEVGGVYDETGRIIPEITPQNFPQIEPLLGGSSGVDVTGGMLVKVRDMLKLVSDFPSLTIHIFDGTEPSLLEQMLCNQALVGTRIQAGR